jgi:hypothetical protein
MYTKQLNAEIMLARIDEFLDLNQISATRFGVMVFRNPNFVHRLRRGVMPRALTYRKVYEFLEHVERYNFKLLH